MLVGVFVMSIAKGISSLVIILGVGFSLNASSNFSGIVDEQQSLSAVVGTSKSLSQQADVLFKEGEVLWYTGEYSQAFSKYNAAADAGHNKAKCAVADMLFHGNGTRKSIDRAIELYQECCGEVPEAALQLGFICEGVLPETAEDYPANDENALYYYKLAEKLGSRNGRDNYKRLVWENKKGRGGAIIEQL